MDPYLGEIRMFAPPFTPKGWLPCDGRTLPISGNEALYSLLGQTYGGDGSTNFGLPDLRGRALLSQGTNPGASSYRMGQVGGAETVTLNVEQMAAHTHAVKAQSATGEGSDPSKGYWCAQSVGNLYVKTPTTNMATTLVSQTPPGPTNPHENMMPFMCVNFIICSQGIYPSFD